jgi:hypothetical protein
MGALVDQQNDPQRRLAGLEPCHPRHQPQAADRGHGIDPYDGRAARLAPSVGGIGDQRKGLLGALEEALALWRQGNAPGLPLEHPEAQPALQPRDPPADRPMGQFEGRGGGRKAAGPRRRLEGAQGVQGRQGFQAVSHTHSSSVNCSFVNRLVAPLIPWIVLNSKGLP